MKTQFRIQPVRRYCLVAVLVVLSGSGCGGTPAPAPADENQARQTLVQALASWQKGEKAESMKNGNPSIQISDPSWENGAALKKYEVEGGGKPSGAERAFTVNLWLTDSKGKESRQQVVYKVGTSPIFTVFRALF
jgi:hypothetical protein